MRTLNNFRLPLVPTHIDIDDFPRISMWSRTFTRNDQSRVRKGVHINAAPLAPKKSVTYILGPNTTRELHRRMVEDSALLLRCSKDRVILLDNGDVKYLWQEDGKHSDVVVYQRAKSGRAT